MKDLLKEAIADAKAVRETALANAKLALEEAFTPRLQSMLSAKLAEEMSDDEEMHEEEEMHDEDEMTEGEEMHDDEMTEGEEMEDSEMSENESDGEEMTDDDDDLDLDEIIAELEMDEELDSSEIGTGDNEVDELEADTIVDDELFAEGEDEEMSDDEDVDITEIIRSLREEDEEEMHEEESNSDELEEAYNVIRFLKGKINEVNLLNAKLLYSNKLFRNFTLNESQKMKVIENFDRAFTLREVKLVYSTLAESFKMPTTKKIVKESFASKPVASTKPAKQVLSEGADLAARFKKLAGLK